MCKSAIGDIKDSPYSDFPDCHLLDALVEKFVNIRILQSIHEPISKIVLWFHSSFLIKFIHNYFCLISKYLVLKYVIIQ
jgi:hypothetical protein